MLHFLNGKWVKEKDLTISILDIAVLRGFGIFDFLRSYGQKPFMLKEHIDRFFNSAKIFGVTPVYTHQEITDIVMEGIKKNNTNNVAIKIVQTGGVSVDGFTPGEKPSFFVFFTNAPVYPTEFYTKGIKLMTSPVMRQFPTGKSINYMASITEVIKAQKKGAKDILHTDIKGNIYEATRSNFYGVKNGKLITAEDGILLGITRKVILQLAKRLKIPVIKKSIKVNQLSSLDEAFISNSGQEIVPVVQIDTIKIGTGKIGSTTQLLMNEYKNITRSI